MNQTPQSIVINLPQGLSGGTAPALPQWVRLPRDGEKETYSGLSRSSIWRMIVAGVVESKVLKNPLNPAASRGARLVRLASLLRAIEGEVNAAATAEQPLPPAA